jgi:hypothetical protein
LVENGEELAQVAKGLLDTVVGRLNDDGQRLLLSKRGLELDDLIMHRAYVISTMDVHRCMFVLFSISYPVFAILGGVFPFFYFAVLCARIPPSSPSLHTPPHPHTLSKQFQNMDVYYVVMHYVKS